MYQRKDKTEKTLPGGQEGIIDLFKLLESSDPQEVESVKSVFHENLSSVRDSKLLNCIVDYYMTLHSERALDILVRVKDPHDKHLFDKINELMKSTNTCYQSLQLLCNLVYRQPTWIHRIANHRLMSSLFQLLKNDVHAPNLVSALFIVVSLLPMIPSQFGSFLNDTFSVFSRLISWNVKKPSTLSETFVLHLQVGVYSLFHRLYGMFPCNFLAYLRSFYGGRDYNEDNFKVFTKFIKPMLERVRLHPLLVTASKETELSTSRWKKMEYHDVIIDCASISLDAIEGTLDGLYGRNQGLNSAPRRHSSLCAQNSLQYVSLSSQSSVMSSSVEPVCLVAEAVSSHRDSLWSPSHAYVASNKATSPLTNKADSEAAPLNSMEPLSLDLAVEAKPEEIKGEKGENITQKISRSPSKESKHDLKDAGDESFKIESVSAKEHFKSSEKKSFDSSSVEWPHSSTEKNILLGVEAKEEDIDKEVCDLTSSSNQPEESEIPPSDIRQDTPFCSTTQNLTDEPPNLNIIPASMPETSEILTKSHDDDVDEMYNSMQDEPYIPPFSRFRYLSHCGPPPVIPYNSTNKPKVVRSNSCPAKFYSSSHSSLIANEMTEDIATTTVVATCSSSVITSAGAFVTISNNIILPTPKNLNYEQLIPMAMEPLPDITKPPHASLESNYHSYNSLFTSLSPPELLDTYVQLGSETYVSSIPITSSRNTDWTHFGGKPPPDEVDILRKQILLLHNQLLFERHRKDIHSERIRRILGRAKKAKMQEELIVALKEQINLLEKDNEDLKKDLFNTKKYLDSFKLEKKRIETELNHLIVKVKLENTQLQFANKKLQNLLVVQKEENDTIISDSKLYQEKIIDLDTELRLCKQEVQCYRQWKKESGFLSKQLFLLQEVNNLYKDKIERLKQPSKVDDRAEMVNEAAFIEINDLKIKLESACFQLDAAKSKISGLEQLISNMKIKEKKQHEVIKNITSFHKDEMDVCQEHITELKQAANEKDSLIMELCKEKETLAERIANMEKKLTGADAVAIAAR